MQWPPRHRSRFPSVLSGSPPCERREAHSPVTTMPLRAMTSRRSASPAACTHATRSGIAKRGLGLQGAPRVGLCAGRRRRGLREASPHRAHQRECKAHVRGLVAQLKWLALLPVADRRHCRHGAVLRTRRRSCQGLNQPPSELAVLTAAPGSAARCLNATLVIDSRSASAICPELRGRHVDGICRQARRRRQMQVFADRKARNEAKRTRR